MFMAIACLLRVVGLPNLRSVHVGEKGDGWIHTNWVMVITDRTCRMGMVMVTGTRGTC